MFIRYTSDPHLLHLNIIKYCRRPFGDVESMDRAILKHLREAESDGVALYILGDLTFNPALVLERYGGLKYPERHLLLAGNHDRLTSKKPEVMEAYRQFAHTTIGTEKTWRSNRRLVEDTLHGKTVRVLLSHIPQQDIEGAHYNVYGHFHNRYLLSPEKLAEDYPWLAKKGPGKYFNAGVDLHGFKPVSLEEMVERGAAGERLL